MHQRPFGSCGQRTSGGRRRHGRRSGRKERVLHTRVSEQLSEDIRRFAEELRVPTSNLVRNVLEEVFTVVDHMSEDVGDLFDDLLEEAEGVRGRVRRQSDASRRRRERRAESDADVEDELRRDEAREARDRSGPSPEAESSPEAEPAPEPEPPRPSERFPDVLGWQPLVLNRDLACGCCERRLRAGDSAFLGLGAQGLTETALCRRCAGRR